MLSRAGKRIGLILLALGGLLVVTPGQACDDPVFRVALETWAAEPYELIVFHRGPLNTDEKAAVELLSSAAKARPPLANVKIEVVDVEELEDPSLLKFIESQPQLQLPLLMVRYPSADRIPRHAWAGRLTLDNARALLDSPARRELARRLTDDHSAVFVLVESGNRKVFPAVAAGAVGASTPLLGPSPFAGAALLAAEQIKQQQDDAAATLLRTQLAWLAKTVTPSEPPKGKGGSPSKKADVPVPPLKIKFSILRLSRHDPAERLFLEMLLRIDSDLGELSQPMVFPVFGRGRARFPLIGAGIEPKNLKREAEFLLGPCKCEIAEQSESVNLLVQADWDALIKERVVKSPELPPLHGLGGFTPLQDKPAAPARKQPANGGGRADAAPAPTGPAVAPVTLAENAAGTTFVESPLFRNALAAVVAAFALLGLTFLVLRRKSANRS
jgi:hypothetical protein